MISEKTERPGLLLAGRYSECGPPIRAAAANRCADLWHNSNTFTPRSQRGSPQSVDYSGRYRSARNQEPWITHDQDRGSIGPGARAA